MIKNMKTLTVDNVCRRNIFRRYQKVVYFLSPIAKLWALFLYKYSLDYLIKSTESH